MKWTKLSIVVIVAVVIVLFVINTDSNSSSDIIFQARLADPSVYENGVFIDAFDIKKGNYTFRFTPNGDSPQILSIQILDNNTILFSEDFKLKGTPQGEEFARYYTWDYQGKKELDIDEEKRLYIKIDPHKNILGPVTVELIKFT